MISMRVSKAAETLQAKYHGEDVCFTGCSTDTRTLKDKELFIALRGENFNGHDYLDKAKALGASAVLVDEKHAGASSFTGSSILVRNTRQAMGELAKSWRAGFSIPLVAITGSNGKTTVKEMVAGILSCKASVLATQGNLNNDIGVPQTLFGMGEEHQYAVIEMGANHPGEIEWLSNIAQPTVATITQCAPAHLEGFGSIEGVAQAKSEIFNGLQEDGVAVINGDDDFAELWMEKSNHYNQLTFGLGSGNEVTAELIIIDEDKSSFQMITPVGNIELTLNLPGRHNILNAMEAAACAISLGITLSDIKQGLESISAVKGRLQIKFGLKQCRIIDDTYNANPASLDAALKVLQKFPGRHWLVIGDMGELGDDAEALHARAGEISKASGVERLYTLGELSRASAEAFGEGAQHMNNHEQLARLLSEEVAADVTVLIKGSRAMGMEYLVDALGVNAPVVSAEEGNE
jgi:UDP-N-acetylmuramoyl-tripeptide--D-alanyl-D-alanine ligase